MLFIHFVKSISKQGGKDLSIIHFLNVKQGDCSVIEHDSGRVTVIDVCNARIESDELINCHPLIRALKQKITPENPIKYLARIEVKEIFRFILTHPDMDHMDGIKDLFEKYSPLNFYDTNNTKSIEFEESSPYRKEDWLFYKALRDANNNDNPRRFTELSGKNIPFLTKDQFGKAPGDQIFFFSPTEEIVNEANESGNFNNCSHVIMHASHYGKVLFCGDTDSSIIDDILSRYGKCLENIDLLIAPHHGRKLSSGYRFLDLLNPKMTFFGNVPSDDLALSSWRYRNLPFVTNKQAGNIVVDIGVPRLPIYVSNSNYAKQENDSTYFSDNFMAWFLQYIK